MTENRYLRLGYIIIKDEKDPNDILDNLSSFVAYSLVAGNYDIELSRSVFSSKGKIKSISVYSSEGSLVTVCDIDRLKYMNTRRMGNKVEALRFKDMSDKCLYVAISDIVYNKDLKPPVTRCTKSLTEILNIFRDELDVKFEYMGMKFRKPIYVHKFEEEDL